MFRLFRDKIEVRQIGTTYYMLENKNDVFNNRYWYLISAKSKEDWLAADVVRSDHFDKNYNFNCRRGIALSYDNQPNYVAIYLNNEHNQQSLWNFLDISIYSGNNLYRDEEYYRIYDNVWPDIMTDKEIFSIKVKGA